MDREDAEDFRQFMAARSAALLRTAYLLTGDRGHAEDLVQSALTKAYRHWGKVRRSGSPRRTSGGSSSTSATAAGAGSAPAPSR